MFFDDDEMNAVKLIDFGSSDDLNDQSIRQTFDNEAENKKRGIHKYFVGTAQYMPPECMHNQPTDYSSDIWSLGCILY
jgi:serine/threonine protein kinase